MISYKNDHYPVYIYDWKAWQGFLIPSMFNDAIKIEGKIRQANADVFKHITSDCGYFLFHLNLTKTGFFFKDKEELVAGLKSKGLTPLNGQINDSSKQHLQKLCAQTGINVTRASVDGDENELLIIKTNFNHGGKPEKRLSWTEFRRLRLGSDNYDNNVVYPVMERKKIKSKIWKDKNLIVEKYISNEENYFFRVYKLLDKIVISEVINHDLIKKMTPGIKRNNYYYDLNDIEILPGVNNKFNGLVKDIALLCQALNLDFGALDVVKSDDNEYYIIDVNTTPNWNIHSPGEILDFLTGALRQKETQEM